MKLMKTHVYGYIFLFTISFLTLPLQGFFEVNASQSAYGEEGSGNSDYKMYYSNDISIKYLIALGANHFLKSSAKMDELSSLLELTDISSEEINYETLKQKIDSAISHMEIAKNVYFRLKNLAYRTPYNYKIIDKLLTFNYSEFQQKKNLLPSIFENVESFLSKGDVTGIYKKLYIHTEQILNLLYLIKNDICSKRFPSLENCWHVIQSYSELKLFGQYVTRIFYSIDKVN